MTPVPGHGSWFWLLRQHLNLLAGLGSFWIQHLTSPVPALKYAMKAFFDPFNALYSTMKPSWKLSQCMCKQIYTQTVQLLPFMTPAARLQTIAAWSWKITLLHFESLDQHSKLLGMPLENWPIQTYLGQYQSDLQTPQLGYYFPLLPLCPEKLKLLLVLLLQQGCPGMTKTGWHAYQKSPTVAAQGQFHQQVHFGFVFQETLL